MANILLVEDDLVSGDVLSRLLRREGHHVHLVRDGYTAIATLDAAQTLGFHPDVILLDLMMPELDGVGVLSHLRQREELRDLSVLVLSALTDGPEVDRVHELGVQGHFVKGSPYFRPLLDTIAQLSPPPAAASDA
jgi:chemosensory pili system protein ChpA (sensor histidine kinase/response regulator)